MNAQPKRKSAFWYLLLVLLLAAVGLAFWYYTVSPQSTVSPAGARNEATAGQGAAGGGRRGGPMSPVLAATAQEQSIPRFLSGLGTVTAANTVTVRSQVSGPLLALHFIEGQQVQAGDLLAEIDPRPFNVQLSQAEGQLAATQATLDNARRDLARYQQLSKTNLVSRQELDTQQAQVREAEANLKVNNAAVDNAKLQLEYSKITAPIAGRVGLKLVDIGNLIGTSDTTGIVVITQTHPIDIIFSLPESEIATLVAAQKSSQPVVVEAWDRTNRHQLTQGALLSLDNQIDSTTGTIRLKARFDNQDDILFPNQFVNARIKVATLQNAVVIPSAAVQMGNEGSFVWVLGKDDQVSKRLVTTSVVDSQQVVIATGLQAGERVVTDGIDRLTEGMKVEVLTPGVTTAGEAPVTERHAKSRRS